MKKFSGTITALASPFFQRKIDRDSFEKLLEQQVHGGIQGFVVNGTTGESPTLEPEEVQSLFEITRKTVGNRIPIILGTGSNSTDKTIKNTQRAEQLGADAALVVVPYYNKPTQAGLIEHFSAVAASVQIPILLYNVPGRTITSLSVSSIVELAKIKNIVGIKEATGDLALARDIRAQVGEHFLITSGDDATAVEMCETVGDGIISVVSHVIPEEVVKSIREAKGRSGAGQHFLEKYRGLLDAIYAESNPIGIKMALFQMGIFKSPELRLPLVEMSPGAAERLRHEIKKLELDK